MAIHEVSHYKFESRSIKFPTKLLGNSVYYFKEVNSTNDIAKELAEEGKPEGSIVIAEKQLKGRGKQNRLWFSPKGGLWFSLILRPHWEVNEISKSTLIAAVSVCETIQKITELYPQIKWPNDIYLSGKKIAGILTEVSIKNNCVDYLILGIGINVNIPQEKFPKELSNTATSLFIELGKKVSLYRLLSIFLSIFENYYLNFEKDLEDSIIAKWRSFSDTLGKLIYSTDKNGNPITGYALDVASDGSLIVQTVYGEVKKIIGGEINTIN